MADSSNDFGICPLCNKRFGDEMIAENRFRCQHCHILIFTGSEQEFFALGSPKDKDHSKCALCPQDHNNFSYGKDTYLCGLCYNNMITHSG